MPLRHDLSLSISESGSVYIYTAAAPFRHCRRSKRLSNLPFSLTWTAQIRTMVTLLDPSIRSQNYPLQYIWTIRALLIQYRIASNLLRSVVLAFIVFISIREKYHIIYPVTAFNSIIWSFCQISVANSLGTELSILKEWNFLHVRSVPVVLSPSSFTEHIYFDLYHTNITYLSDPFGKSYDQFLFLRVDLVTSIPQYTHLTLCSTSRNRSYIIVHDSYIWRTVMSSHF